jgi:hypothetical protein
MSRAWLFLFDGHFWFRLFCSKQPVFVERSCLVLRQETMHNSNIVRAKYLLHGLDLGQHIHNGSVRRKDGANVGFVEDFGYVDAAVGYAVVADLRRCKPLKPALCGVRGTHTVHRDSRVIVHPNHVLTQRVVAAFSHEAPCWSRAFVWTYLGNRTQADARSRVIAPRRAKQHRGRVAKPCVGIEHIHSGTYLVDDNEIRTCVIARIGYPVCYMASIWRDSFRAEIGKVSSGYRNCGRCMIRHGTRSRNGKPARTDGRRYHGRQNCRCYEYPPANIRSHAWAGSNAHVGVRVCHDDYIMLLNY